MFPQGLLLPESVLEERRQRKREMINTTLRGILLRCLIVIVELIGFWIYSSSTLFVDALSTLMDVFSSIVLVLSIKAADRPPDREHPFGHGRYEPLAGLQLGIFLTLTGCFLFGQQVMAFWQAEEVSGIDSRTWLIPFGAVILLEIAHHRLIKAAKKQNSPALLAEAVHFRVDSLNTGMALVILAVAALVPEWKHWIDHLGALLIATVMIGMGAYASKHNLNQLLDRVPDDSFFKRVRQAALRVKEVKDTEKILIQQHGPDAHVDIDIELDPFLTVEVAHEISQRVRLEIQKEWTSVREVVVHIEPYYADDHDPKFV